MKMTNSHWQKVVLLVTLKPRTKEKERKKKPSQKKRDRRKNKRKKMIDNNLFVCLLWQTKQLESTFSQLF